VEGISAGCALIASTYTLAPPGSRTPRRVHRVAAILAALLVLTQAGGGTLRFASHVWSAIRFPYPLDYGEGPILDQAVRLGRLENIYPPDLSRPPFRVSNYPPLHLLPQAALTRLFGPAYWYGRVLAAGGVLAAAAGISLVLRALGADWIAALAGGLLLLSFPLVLDWSRLDRVDGLALGLSIAALVVAARHPERRRSCLVAAVLLVAAISTRQSHALAGPFTLFVFLLARRQRRRALETAATIAALTLAVFGALQVATGGGFFRHVVTANVNPFLWPRVWPYLGDLWTQAPALVLGAAAFAIAGRQSPAWWLVVPYLAGATASALTVGKLGSGVNYLYELCAALALATGALLAWTRRWPWLRIGLLVVVAAQFYALDRWTAEHREGPLRARLAQRGEIDRLFEIVRTAEGPVLADEMMGLLPLSGRPVWLQPFEFQLLAWAGLWREDAVVRDIEQARFAVILLYDPPDFDSPRQRWSDREREAILRRYQPTERWADNVVLRPRP
jgi:dolichyl-phosphate-mannose-protein mannosyltransferase